MIFVDTSVWSLAFRRSNSVKQITEVLQLHELISQDAPLAVTGIVMQELLSGLREEAQFKRLPRAVGCFSCSACKSGSPRFGGPDCQSLSAGRYSTDCLIAAICIANNSPLLTADKDFEQMAVFCDLRLYQG